MTQVPRQDAYALAVAAEVRALLARHRLTRAQIAPLLVGQKGDPRSATYVSKRTQGHLPFDVRELWVIASLCGISVVDILQAAHVRCLDSDTGSTPVTLGIPADTADSDLLAA